MIRGVVGRLSLAKENRKSRERKSERARENPVQTVCRRLSSIMQIESRRFWALSLSFSHWLGTRSRENIYVARQRRKEKEGERETSALASGFIEKFQ